MYKFKLKEIEVGDTDIKKGVKTTVSDIDPETGAITYDVENVADFSSTYNALQQAREFLNTLEKTGNAKNDTTIDKFAEDIAKLFNAFRSHIRKNYPEEYKRVLRLKEALSIAGKKVNVQDKTADQSNSLMNLNFKKINSDYIFLSGVKYRTESKTVQGQDGPLIYAGGIQGKHLSIIDLSLKDPKTPINDASPSFYRMLVIKDRLDKYQAKDPSKTLKEIYADQPAMLDLINSYFSEFNEIKESLDYWRNNFNLNKVTYE